MIEAPHADYNSTPVAKGKSYIDFHVEFMPIDKVTRQRLIYAFQFGRGVAGSFEGKYIIFTPQKSWIASSPGDSELLPKNWMQYVDITSQ